MISVAEYLGQHGAGHESELTDELRGNADVIVEQANALLAEFGEDRGLRSGWRPKSVNDATPNAARASKHISCQAIDIEDNDHRLKEFVLKRNEYGAYPVLEQFGLYAEFAGATPSWLHVQFVPPGSGKRVYAPNATWAARMAAEVA